MCVAVPTDDGRNSYVFNGARTTKSTRTIFFLPRTLRQSLSCVLIPFPCVLPGSRVEFCQWCALVRCLSFLLDVSVRTFRPKAPQNQSPRDIHTLTSFWCYRLSFVAYARRENVAGKRLRENLEKHHMRATSAELGGATWFGDTGFSLIDYVWAPTALPLRWSGPLRKLGAELQLIDTRKLRDHVPLGTPMLSGRCESGYWRGDFLAALDDMVKGEETQWAPLLQLPSPDLLDDYLNKVLVETGQRFSKKEPMDAPGYADLAARRRELLKNRLEARKDIGEDRFQGQEGLDSSEELLQRVRAAEEQLARTSAALKAIRCRLRRSRQSS